MMTDQLQQRADERMPDMGGRVALIERSILVLLVVGLFIGVLAIIKPFTTAILFGATLATTDASGVGPSQHATPVGGRSLAVAPAYGTKKCGSCWEQKLISRRAPGTENVDGVYSGN